MKRSAGTLHSLIPAPALLRGTLNMNMMTMTISSDKPAIFHTPRILSVDENPLIQQVTKSMIHLLGAQCISTNQPDEALKLFREGYDLVLLDLRFLYISGFELAQQMREEESIGIRTPIIGHATVADPEEVEPLCLAAGMDALHTKLTSVQEVYELLTRWLRHPLVMPIHLLDVHVPTYPQARNNGQTCNIDQNGSYN
jgi:CheY-like chemotaxis protein